MDMLLAHLLDAAGRAPSAHNTQPWLLRPLDVALEVRIQRDRMLPAVDPSGADLLHALGALLENVLLTLAARGLDGSYEVQEGAAPESVVLTIRWRPAEQPAFDPTLYRMIPIRRTSRLPYEPEAIPASTLAELESQATAPCRLRVLTDPSHVDEIRRLATDATVEQMADAPVAAELYRWLRFSRRDPRWYRDGLNASCMAWKRWEALLGRVLLAPLPLRLLSRAGLLRRLAGQVDQQAPRAPAVALLVLRGEGHARRIEAGRCLQRIWLTAAARGLVTHPISAAVDVSTTRPRVYERFGLGPDDRHVNLFRLGRSAPPSRSPRLPADELLALPAPPTIA
jgi:nitroreductase